MARVKVRPLATWWYVGAALGIDYRSMSVSDDPAVPCREMGFLGAQACVVRIDDDTRLLATPVVGASVLGDALDLSLGLTLDIFDDVVDSPNVSFVTSYFF